MQSTENSKTDKDIAKFTDVIRQFVEAGDYESAKNIEKLLHAKGLYAGSVNTEQELRKFLTQDEKMLKLKDTVRLLAPLEDSVLIIGETGTGKEIIARALHGARGPYTPEKTNLEQGRFVGMACPSLSTDLMFSELFGHIKGAFTGANEDKVGKLQYAYRGTLFFDECGDMPMSMQAGLLRALQERVITRVGCNKEIPVDFRLVCATHMDIKGMVASGKFREDLYNRISTFELHTTPLRERVGDIELIVKELDKKGKFPLKEFLDKTFPHIESIKELPADSVFIPYKRCGLPGNVRELQRLVRRFTILGTYE